VLLIPAQEILPCFATDLLLHASADALEPTAALLSRLR
jgi:hypothetical protein